MELNFLGSNKQEKARTPEKVSTGNSPPETTKNQKVSDIQYDKTKGNLDQTTISQGSEGLDRSDPEKAYENTLQRCREYAASQGFTIVATLKDALRDRANGARSCTIREADIAIRSGVHLKSEYLEMQLKHFGAFLAEETITLTEGIFELRSAYNKGLEWVKLKRELCSKEKQKKGDERLIQIQKLLKLKGFQLHPEEIEHGFHADLLKPEYMDWQQFSAAIKRAVQFKSMETKEREKQELELVNGQD